MANIEFSGVLGDSDLSLKLSPGPHPTNGSERGIYFWPEISRIFQGWRIYHT